MRYAVRPAPKLPVSGDDRCVLERRLETTPDAACRARGLKLCANRCCALCAALHLPSDAGADRCVPDYTPKCAPNTPDAAGCVRELKLCANRCCEGGSTTCRLCHSCRALCTGAMHRSSRVEGVAEKTNWYT